VEIRILYLPGGSEPQSPVDSPGRNPVKILVKIYAGEGGGGEEDE